MNGRKVPVSLADPYANVYNASEWKGLQDSVANSQFTVLEIKAFYAIGLIFEICASVDCLLKASLSKNEHPLTYRVFTSGGRYLPAFGVFASGIELLGRCLIGNETPQVNENLKVGFHYFAKPTLKPLLDNIPMSTEVVKTSRSYSIQDLIDLRNYAAHGQSTVGEKDTSGRLLPKTNLPGIERDLFSKLPEKMGSAMQVYWHDALLGDVEPCRRLAKARIDPYTNRIGPLQHVIDYFGQVPYQSAGSMFSRFNW
jgi:hypothetical protein